MRKIVAVEFMALDGVVQDPHEWHFPYFSDEMGEVVGGRMAAADALLLGRKTYEGFAASWPQRGDDEPGAAEMNSIRKYVVSNTLTDPEWNNTTIITGDQMVPELQRLKAEEGRDIWISGSIVLTRSLLRAGLLDELHLLIHPILAGSGQQMFDEGERLPLELAESRIFKNGVLSVVYRRAAEEEA